MDRLLGEHGIAGDTQRGREQFEQRMEERRCRDEAQERQWKAIRRGWCLGTPEFREQLLQRIEGQMGGVHSQELKRESAEVKAGRIIAEELKTLGWKQKDLPGKPKGDPSKLALALRLRRETTLTIREIALLLHMGKAESLNSKLYQWRKRNELNSL